MSMTLEEFNDLDEDQQIDVINRCADSIEHAAGLTREHDSYMIIEDAGADGEKMYIKQMSDGGITDDANGKLVQDYLTAQGVAFESDRLRSLLMNTDDFLRLFAN